jgi:phosphate transport system substrate-binding protein
MKRLSITRSTLCCLTLLALLLATLPATAQSLSQIRKIYVDAFSGQPDPAAMRQHLIDNLRKDKSIQVVDSPSQADATLKTSGEIWIKAYISVNPRSPSSKYPVYGGYLSAQLVSPSGDTLWSWLVTPTHNPSSIPQDLADQLVRKLESAIRNTTPTGVPVTPPSTPSITLKAAGATFPAPLYLAWIESYRQHHPAIQITYDAVGSEGGIQQLRDQRIAFAASDFPLPDSAASSMPTPVLQFATVVGAVVPIYHLEGVGRDLRFTPAILAAIYLGKIRKWNDPAIVAINHGASLPDADIVVIHRGDGSGTTYTFTSFLSLTDPGWKSTVGSGATISWPTGIAAQGNDGVASTVEKTPNSIGYAELSFAIQRRLSYGSVRNAAGNFVQANLISLAAAVSSASTGHDIAPSLLNATGHDAYPITSFTWLLIPQSFPDPTTRAALADFLDWILTTGQKECSALAYTPLPKEIVTHQQELLNKFKSAK